MNGKVLGLKKCCGYVAMFVLTVAMVCMLDVFSSVSLASTGKTNKNAKIRKSADANSTQLGLAAEGTTVEISGETTGKDGKVWYKVTVDGVTGYIRSDLVDANGSGTTENNGNTGNTDSATVDGLEQVVAVEASITGGTTVRVRTSASTANSNNILTTVPNGTKLTVVARTTGSDKKLWYQVKLVVEGKEVIGYVRNDYLSISGEVKPLTEENVTPVEQDTTPAEEQKTEEPEKSAESTVPAKRYDTKFTQDKWYLLDYDENKQYDIAQIFTTAEEFEKNYNTEKANNKVLKTWLTVFILLSIAGCGTAGYLFYSQKAAKDEEYFGSFNDDSKKRTSDRPKRGANAGNGNNGNTGRNPSQQAGGRERPIIKEGLEPRRDDVQRGVQNGQRQTQGRMQNGAKQDNRAAAGARRQDAGAQNGARQYDGRNPQGAQRMQDGSQNQQRMNPANQGMPRQGAGADRGQGARPTNGQMQGGQRPGGPQDQVRRPANGQPQQRNDASQAANNGRAKNFAREEEREFEFINWDNDDE